MINPKPQSKDNKRIKISYSYLIKQRFQGYHVNRTCIYKCMATFYSNPVIWYKVKGNGVCHKYHFLISFATQYHRTLIFQTRNSV